MKISSILRDLLARRAGTAGASDATWTDDPYAHPDIDAMSERERADLPPTHLPAGRPWAALPRALHPAAEPRRLLPKHRQK